MWRLVFIVYDIHVPSTMYIVHVHVYKPHLHVHCTCTGLIILVGFGRKRVRLWECSIYSGGSRISERGGQSTSLGGSGGMLPQKILNFRPSEVVSGAFWVENCFLRLL